MNAPTASTKKKMAADPYRNPSSHGPTNPWLLSTPYNPFGGESHSCLNRNTNDVSTHGKPASPTVVPGAYWASAGACPLSVGEDVSSDGAVATGSEHDGNL